MLGLKTDKGSHITLDEEALDAFCQNLVDYLSSGHFSIYNRIIDRLESENPSSAIAQVYSKLQQNTENIVVLYDSHLEKVIHTDGWLELRQVLSKADEYLDIALFTGR